MEEVLPKVPQLKQHNILVRSYLHLGSIEARIFTLMLKDSQLNNNEFKKNIEIKVNDIIGENPSGKAYQLLKNACDDLLSKKLDLLKLVFQFAIP